jgi:hypothetical protein
MHASNIRELDRSKDVDISSGLFRPRKKKLIIKFIFLKHSRKENMTI